VSYELGLKSVTQVNLKLQVNSAREGYETFQKNTAQTNKYHTPEKLLHFDRFISDKILASLNIFYGMPLHGPTYHTTRRHAQKNLNMFHVTLRSLV
jgi:hypothetical protein